MQKKKILITGSGGFVMSNFIRFLFKNHTSFEVASIDRCNSPDVLNTIYYNKSHSFHIGDVSDPHFMDIIFSLEKPSIIIHAASSEDGINSDIIGIRLLIDNAKKHGLDKLIYISSDDVYPVGLNLTEDIILNPSTNLGIAKLAAEHYLRNSGINYNILRLPNTYGTKQKYGLIPALIKSLINNEQNEVLNFNPQEMRSWVYEQDVCSAIMKLLEFAQSGYIYNIASQDYLNAEIAQEICNAFQKGHELLKFNPNIQQYNKTLSGDKLKALGWTPSFKFKRTVEFICDWYNKNRYFLKGIKCQ
jgi:dTDP-glucose 4,6-dehydratase